jgi:hypothetical protein
MEKFGNLFDNWNLKFNLNNVENPKLWKIAFKIPENK